MIPGSGRSPGEGNGNPLQCSCLENPMDRGALQATVHEVARVGHDLVTKSPPGLGRRGRSCPYEAPHALHLLLNIFFSTLTGGPFYPLLDIRSLNLSKGTVRRRKDGMATGCTLALPRPEVLCMYFVIITASQGGS